MRRNASHLLVPGVLALLAVLLIGGTRGLAEPSHASRPKSAAATPAARIVSTEFLATASLTRTITSAAKKPEPELLHDVVPAAATLGPKTIMMEVTAYCPCKKCCGPDAAGITASGKLVNHNAGQFVAADARVPFHTKLIIPGYANGQAVPVLDRGGAIKGRKLDVFFPTHEQALKWGRRMVPVTLAD